MNENNGCFRIDVNNRTTSTSKFCFLPSKKTIIIVIIMIAERFHQCCPNDLRAMHMPEFLFREIIYILICLMRKILTLSAISTTEHVHLNGIYIYIYIYEETILMI